MDSIQNSLKILLDHVGVEILEDNKILDIDVLNHLMNFSLHSLGGVRQLLQLMEKNRLSKLALGEAEDGNLPALRETFTQAAYKILEASNNGIQINDLDPSRHLIESFPDETKISDKRWLKLQWAIICNKQLKSPLDTLQILSSSDPESIKELDKEGRSILHYASRLEDINLLQTITNITTTKSGYGYDFTNHNGALPLHNVARFGKSYPVYRKVLEAYPQAIQMPNEAGTLPLHWAAAKNSSIEIVKDIILTFPGAISIVNNEGCLPLHTAGQNTNLLIVQDIYQRHPDAIKSLDYEGGYPLHHACCMNPNIDVVAFLYNAFPDAIKTPQADGMLPLHLAASRNSSPAVMKFLLDTYPTAATRPDSVGWLPLHCLLNNSPIDIRINRITCLKLLLHAYPTAVGVPNSNGETPYDMARNKGHHPYIRRMLLSACPEAHIADFGDLNWEARKYCILVLLQYRTSICKQRPTLTSTSSTTTPTTVKSPTTTTTTTAVKSLITASSPQNASSASATSHHPSDDHALHAQQFKFRKVGPNGKKAAIIDDTDNTSDSPTNQHSSYNTTTTTTHTNHTHTHVNYEQQYYIFCRLSKLEGISEHGGITNALLQHIVRFL